MEIPHQVADRQEIGRISMAAIVQAVNLKKTYMLGKVPVNALRGVNLKVESGDFLAVLGPSGSGKSTLLNLIGALDKPTEGKMLIEGVDVSTLSDNQLADLRRRVASCSSSSTLFHVLQQKKMSSCQCP